MKLKKTKQIPVSDDQMLIWELEYEIQRVYDQYIDEDFLNKHGYCEYKLTIDDQIHVYNLQKQLQEVKTFFNLN